jgi:hypothetical protein
MVGKTCSEFLGMFVSCDTRRVSWEKGGKNSKHASTRKDSTMKSETQCAAHPMEHYSFPLVVHEILLLIRSKFSVAHFLALGD